MGQRIDLGSILGPHGDAGATGPQGPAGPQGPQGPQGERGEGLPLSDGVKDQIIVMGDRETAWVDPMDVKTRLGIPSITDATPIESSDSVNNLRIPGTYCCETDETAESLRDVPIDVKFTMVVSKSNGTDEYIGQRITESITGTQYFRSYKLQTGTWSAWRKTLDCEADSIPVEALGLSAKRMTLAPTEININNTILMRETVYGQMCLLHVNVTVLHEQLPNVGARLFVLPSELRPMDEITVNCQYGVVRIDGAGNLTLYRNDVPCPHGTGYTISIMYMLQNYVS